MSNDNTHDDPPAVHQHNEARWLAFTTFVLGNREWHLTLRDGADQLLIDDALALIDYTTSSIMEIQGLYTQSPGMGEQRSTPPASAASSPGDRDHTEEVGRLEITGTLDQPSVKMFSTNANLKFPVLQSRSKIVLDIIEERYGEVSEHVKTELTTCGKTIPLKDPWQVEWQESEKVSGSGRHYRDITKIVIPKFEQRSAEG